jgi:hypothetical protein
MDEPQQGGRADVGGVRGPRPCVGPLREAQDALAGVEARPQDAPTDSLCAARGPSTVKDLRPGKGAARPRRAPQLALEGGEASEHGEHQTLCGPIASPWRLLPQERVSA